jgi:hypothetical protein
MRGRERNSCAGGNRRGSQPAERISSSSDSRTEMSSSTTNTNGVVWDMSDNLVIWPRGLAQLTYYLSNPRDASTLQNVN